MEEGEGLHLWCDLELPVKFVVAVSSAVFFFPISLVTRRFLIVL